MFWTQVRRWWWPAYAFTYPLLFWPGDPGLGAAFKIRAYATIVFLAGGLALELLHPIRRSTRLADVGRELRRHPPVLLVVAFATWVVGTAFFAPDPPIALTGAFVNLGDGAIWMVAMAAVFILVYVRSLDQRDVPSKIALAVVASALVLTLAALAEVLVRHGLVYPIPVDLVPMVTFPQKGHLAGMLALGAGSALGLAPFLIAPVLTFGIGLCLNRSAGAAVFLVALVRTPRFRSLLTGFVPVVIVLAVGLLAGGYVAKSSLPATKEIVSEATGKSRTFYYRAAVRGILARPVLGWGGGNFAFAWPKYLTPDELSTFANMEWGYEDVYSASVSDSAPPLLVIRDKTGKQAYSVVRTFKAHDQVLEAALMWGIPGALMYFAIFGLALQGLRRRSPLSLGILSYAIFVLLWFIIPQTQGLLWAMVAASTAEHRAQTPRLLASSDPGIERGPC